MKPAGVGSRRLSRTDHSPVGRGKPMKDLDMQDNIAEITEIITKGIVEQLGVDASKVTDAAKLVDDLGADSLDVLELVIGMEEHFSVDLFTDDDCGLKPETVTVAQIIEHVRGKLGAGR